MFDCCSIITTSDVNECNSGNGGCEQVCNNGPGSHNCSCVSGYELDSDGFNCSGIYLMSMSVRTYAF